jgi:ERCC4-type nuclease
MEHVNTIIDLTNEDNMMEIEQPLDIACAVTNNETHAQPVINSIKIYIDYREHKLINELNALAPSHIKTENLELGDILIVSKGTYSFVLLFERKAGSDLESSIKDYRYSEQKKRILATYHPSKCTYIIEGLQGFGVNLTNAATNTIIQSAIIHTMYRDNMHVIHTKDVKATAQFIKTVFDKCVAHPQYFCKPTQQISANSSANATTTSINANYISNAHNNNAAICIKSKKCENIDVETCYILQLCQIPGISHIIAKEIIAIYPTYSSLIDALRSCETTANKIKLLKKINMIADKKASKIVEYIVV